MTSPNTHKISDYLSRKRPSIEKIADSANDEKNKAKQKEVIQKANSQTKPISISPSSISLFM